VTTTSDAWGFRLSAGAQRTAHSLGPVLVDDDLRRRDLAHPCAEDHHDVDTTTLAQHAHGVIDEPLPVHHYRRLRLAETAAFPGGEH
jgi:hypothetical protein